MTSERMNTAEPVRVPASIDVVVVGAGFAGLYMLYRLREMGMQAIAFEAADDVGGTWYYNRYPGCRCDVESLQYSYSFSRELQQDWQWTERYATQSEILRYVQHVADRFDLRRDIRFGTCVTSAVYDESRNRWNITTDRGHTVAARFCVMASGSLSVPRKPQIPGVDLMTFRDMNAIPHLLQSRQGDHPITTIGTGGSHAAIAGQVTARDGIDVTGDPTDY